MVWLWWLGEGWGDGPQRKLDMDNQAMLISVGQIQEGTVTQWLGAWALHLQFAPYEQRDFRQLL